MVPGTTAGSGDDSYMGADPSWGLAGQPALLSSFTLQAMSPAPHRESFHANPNCFHLNLKPRLNVYTRRMMTFGEFKNFCNIW